MPAFLNQGTTAVRDTAKVLVTHIGVTTDGETFLATHTAIDPNNVGAANNLIKAATKIDVDFASFDALMEIDGDAEFTGKVINSISACDGAVRTDAITRSPRDPGLGIGVQTGDIYNIGVRWAVEDNTP